jgi:5-formyltetrahydrofolate cyclo-ligase
MTDAVNKSAIRRDLREMLAKMTDADRHAKSLAACSLLSATAEFESAKVVMIFLSTPHEIDTAPLALRAWQAGKTLCVPKVSWNQRRMLPVEISSLNTGMTTTGNGVREPMSGRPIPVEFIDLVIVPGLGFTDNGHRIGRGMGFYDRFLSQAEFIGRSCGLAFEQQIVLDLPVLDHDVPLSMLATDRGVRRFASSGVVSGQ